MELDMKKFLGPKASIFWVWVLKTSLGQLGQIRAKKLIN